MPRWIVLAGICLMWGIASLPTGATEPISFARDIRPLLADHCFSCHGPDDASREADLRLDQYALAIEDRGGYAAIVPGQAEESEIYRRVMAHDPDVRMPPEAVGKPLSSAQVALLRNWIDSGAVYEQHWSFQPIRAVDVPAVQDVDWPLTPIDRFILARLEQRGLRPSRSADRYTLVRRLCLDLLGRLPDPREVDACVVNPATNWYEQLVDRLLANPHFGERWGRYWLDQARYADSHGYTNDDPRVMWPYRDWVIGAFNRDLSFDQFTIEQLAGDLLPEPTSDQLIATGFHRNTLINTEGGVKADQFRDEQVKDRVDTTGVVWMALTIGCAKCHSHKYDPLDQTEYYRLYSFFNSTADNNSIEPTVRLAATDRVGEIDRLAARIADLQKDLASADDLSPSERSAEETAGQAELEQAQARLAELERRFPEAMILQELAAPRVSHVQIRGDFLRLGPEVDAGTPGVLPDLDSAPCNTSRDERSQTGPRRFNRLDLAQWLVRADHPLTARVRVNRIWLRLFGRGLVQTDNDFGTQGSLPTHPQLLDWLALEFQRDWSTKRLLRLIVNSAVYRQSSAASQRQVHDDPLNQWLARQSRLRVDAEIIRDLALSAADRWSPIIGGPSVYPPQAEGVYAFTQHNREWPTSIGQDRYRRGMYTFFYRSAPHPLLSTFDVPKFNQSCTRRDRSNTPLQSLTLANDEALYELAGITAERVLAMVSEAGHGADTDVPRIELMFRICLVRPPSAAEVDRLLRYLRSERERFARLADPANPPTRGAVRENGGRLESVSVTAAASRPPGRSMPQSIQTQAWTSVARVIMNLDEFITRE